MFKHAFNIGDASPDPSGKEKGELVVRAYLPNAEECSVAKLNKSCSNKKEVLFPLERIGNSDVFEGVLDGQKEFLPTSLKLPIITEQYTNFMTLTAFFQRFPKSPYTFSMRVKTALFTIN